VVPRFGRADSAEPADVIPLVEWRTFGSTDDYVKQPDKGKQVSRLSSTDRMCELTERYHQ